MDRFWRYVAHHMLRNFVLGYICLIVSIVIWVCGRGSPELVIPIVVIACWYSGTSLWVSPLHFSSVIPPVCGALYQPLSS